jgi:hypothetical protein
LEPESLTIREAFLRREEIRVWASAQEVKAKFDQGSWLVHHATGDIDVDDESSDRWPEGLEVTPP